MNELETLRALSLDALRTLYREVAGEECPATYTRDQLVAMISEEPPRGEESTK